MYGMQICEISALPERTASRRELFAKLILVLLIEFYISVILIWMFPERQKPITLAIEICGWIWILMPLNKQLENGARVYCTSHLHPFVCSVFAMMCVTSVSAFTRQPVPHFLLILALFLSATWWSLSRIFHLRFFGKRSLPTAMS